MKRAKARVDSSAQLSPKQIIIEFVLDETGSMGSVVHKTISGFNQFVSDQKKQDGDCRLSLSKFEGGNVVTPYENIPIDFVPEMNTSTFIPKGMTNLYDAIGERISSLSTKLKEWSEKPDVLFVVMTDGFDNHSREYSISKIKNLISTKREEGWGFAYIGVGNELAAKSLGYLDGEILIYDQVNIDQTFNQLSVSTTSYRATRAAGLNSTLF